MCLAVPMRIKELRSEDAGVAEVEGLENEINISLLETPKRGDYVIVHAGFAIEQLDEEEALERIALFEELAELAAQ